MPLSCARDPLCETKRKRVRGDGGLSCAPGSISFVLAVLEGRLDLEAAANPVLKRLQSSAADEVTTYRKAVEEAFVAPTPQSLQALHTEATRFCTLSNGFFPSGAPREKLEEILDVIIVEPDAFDFARNEGRTNNAGFKENGFLSKVV